MIGAAALSDIAADMEKAADGKRVTDIIAGHTPMLERYRETVRTIRTLLCDVTGEPASDPFLQEDSEIMEFFPE